MTAAGPAPAPPSSAAPPLLSLEHVSVARAGRTILDDVSLALRPGEVTALIGPSGAGKSTLIGACNGLTGIDAGRVVVPQGTLAGPLAWAAHRRQCATIFQDLALVEHVSALHNVLIGLAERRSLIASLLPWPNETKLAATRLLATLGIGHLALSRVDRLSGGERRRVAIARALIRQAPLLLADEPLNSLDPALARQVARLFSHLAADRSSAVLVTLHQVDLLPALADRVVGLERGRIVLDAPAAEVRPAEIAALFAPRPQAPRGPHMPKQKGTANVLLVAPLAYADPP